ncbi:MAG: DUF4254 domain-containing protein [Parafilimonas terrae]|nr:DUF4254 domain-containing protein [Parafilimonas terrae]
MWPSPTDPAAIPSAAVIRVHDDATAAFFRDGSQRPPSAEPIWQALSENHLNNMRLWAEEDLARRRQAPDSAIAANKRAIDGYNQARNDATERMDDLITAALNERMRDGARQNSETPGSIIDRMSIASLKIFHMRAQVSRADVDTAHREACTARWQRLSRQRAILATCLDELLADCRRGAARFGVYRQYKMYNDPRLNMVLVEESRTSA